MGAQEISAARRTPPREIGHFLVRLNGTSVVDWHAARTKIPACHEGNVRVETTAEGWSIFRRKLGGVNARILPSAASTLWAAR